MLPDFFHARTMPSRGASPASFDKLKYAGHARADRFNKDFGSAFIDSPNLISRVLVWVGLAEYYTFE